MPNWIGNTIILTGTADEIRKLHETGFEFEKLLPSPSEASVEWCDQHWGTKWSADIDRITYEPGSTTMKVDCRTANGAPYGLLAFLTLQSPTLRISHTIEQEYGYIMGHVVYKEGVMDGGAGAPGRSRLRSLLSRCSCWMAPRAWAPCRWVRRCRCGRRRREAPPC